MGKTTIEWTDVTDNIIVAGGGGWWCRRISPGCDHCYAEALNQNSFFGGNKKPYRGAPPVLKLRQDIIDGWAKQRKPKLHFVSSMTDIFGEWVPQWMISQFLNGMVAAPKQTFQLLTKRPEVMLQEVCLWLDDQAPSNIRLGCTVENQEWANKRRQSMQELAEIGFTTFVSYEPALGPVDWTGWEFVDQIISGGESGKDKDIRPSHPDWHRATRDWCQANGRAYFFKQWGEWANWEIASLPKLDRNKFKSHLFSKRPYEDEEAIVLHRVGKKNAGRLLDGREWNEIPGLNF